jgi:hypothetical protein
MRRVTYRLLLSDQPGGAEMSTKLREPIAAYFGGAKEHDADARLALFAAFTLAGDKISHREILS